MRIATISSSAPCSLARPASVTAFYGGEMTERCSETRAQEHAQYLCEARLAELELTRLAPHDVCVDRLRFVAHIARIGARKRRLVHPRRVATLLLRAALRVALHKNDMSETSSTQSSAEEIVPGCAYRRRARRAHEGRASSRRRRPRAGACRPSTPQTAGSTRTQSTEHRDE